jgi:uridine kinase
VDWTAFHGEVGRAASGGADAVIVEGLLTLWDEELRDRLDLRVFVDCLADERIVRRLRRNMSWRYSFDKVSDVYLDMVRFRHEQYVEPTKWTADVIVNGAGNTDKACEMIAGWIEK